MATQSEALTTEATTTGRAIRHRPWGRYILRYIALTLGALVVLLPIYMTVVNALLAKESIVSYPPKLLPFECGWDICSASGPQWGNFPKALDQVPLTRYMLNSTIQTGIIVVGQLVTASLAAYAFAFLRFPGRGILFLIFLSTLMVPLEVSIIPNFQTVQWMTHKPDIQIFGFDFAGKVLSKDSYQALTIPFLATGFGTFLLRQHFMTIPKELRDAAAIDGYGHLRFLLFVVLPLSRPVLASLAVFAFLSAWNQYLWPLLVTDDDNMRTVQIGVAALRGREIDSFNVVMAGTLIAAMPMFAMLVAFQGQLVRGLTAGAVKR
jgi:ABC-type glycerol-3-phosphate transport system permease component